MLFISNAYIYIYQVIQSEGSLNHPKRSQRTARYIYIYINILYVSFFQPFFMHAGLKMVPFWSTCLLENVFFSRGICCFDRFRVHA